MTPNLISSKPTLHFYLFNLKFVTLSLSNTCLSLWSCCFFFLATDNQVYHQCIFQPHQFLQTAEDLSTVLWNTSGTELTPNMGQRNLQWPKGVLNVQRQELLSSSMSCQKPKLASSSVKYLAVESLQVISYVVGS